MPTALGSKLMIGAATLHTNTVNTLDRARLTENTHSGKAASNYEKVVEDNAWEAEVPWDDTNLPDTDFGLVPGVQVTLVSYFGSSGKTETLTGTTVEQVRHIKNNANDILRSIVSGKGGAITRAVT